MRKIQEKAEKAAGDVHPRRQLALHSTVLLGAGCAVLGWQPTAKGSPADVLALLAVGLAWTVPGARIALVAPAFWRGVAALFVTLAWGAWRSPTPAIATVAAAKMMLWIVMGRLVWSLAQLPAFAKDLLNVIVYGGLTLAGAGVLLVVVALLGAYPVAGTSYYAHFPLGFSAVRWVGFFPNANDMAVVLLCALVLGFAAKVLPYRRWGLLLAGLLVTLSRLLVLGIALTMLQLGRRRVRWQQAALAVAAGMLQLGATWTTHIAITTAAQEQSLWIARAQPWGTWHGLYLWRMGYLELKVASFAMWLAHPWLGVGLRGFAAYLPNFTDPEIRHVLPTIGSTPHSTYAFVLAELGLLGAVAVALAIRTLWRSTQHTPGWLVWSGILAVVAIDYELQHHRLLYIVTGLLAAAPWDKPDAPRQ